MRQIFCCSIIQGVSLNYHRRNVRSRVTVSNFQVSVSARDGSSGWKNVRQKIPPNGQTRIKFGFSYEISQHNHFRDFLHHFGSSFPRNPTKPMFCSFPTTPLMRWRFQHTCWWIWRFRGCPPHSPKEKKPNNWLQETWWHIRLSQSVFDILTTNFQRKNGGNMILTVFYHLIFLDIEFHN